MSNASSTPSDDAAFAGRRHVGSRFALVPALHATGFWLAVTLPFVLVSLLAIGLADDNPLLVAGLLASNVAGLVLGRDYKR